MCDRFSRPNHRLEVYTKQKSVRTLIFHRTQDEAILVHKREQLIKTLQMHNVFETEIDRNRRKYIMHKLNVLVKSWMKNLVMKKRVHPNEAWRFNTKILTFGSYKLGVHDETADLDTVLVSTMYVTREDFFTSFWELLSSQKDIEELRAIVYAYVPLIKMKILGIEVDVLFARLWVEELPDYMDLRDNQWMFNLEESCVRSLNGYRVTLQLLYLVPNVQKFRLALRTIRLWAKRKGIYSNILGYLGGVSWAILVAKICITYPNVDVVEVIEKFFEVFSQWRWPEPVLLQEPEKCELGYPIWNPAQYRDLMPIILPAYPERNSSFNVLFSTQQIIQEELKRAYIIIRNINLGNARWCNLFERPNFFGQYSHYIELRMTSQIHRHQVVWRGFIESKMRYFTSLLESSPTIVRVHVNPELFKPNYQITNQCYIRYIGLWLKEGEGISDDIMNRIHVFLHTVKVQAEHLDELTDDMDLDANVITRNNLWNYGPSVTI